MGDVTVYGAGIFGLSVAWACLKRGARVQVIDPHGIAAGASGGIVGALAPHTPENWNAKKQFQFESLTMAQAYWDEIHEVSGQDPGYARHGRLQHITDANGHALAQERAENATTLWQGKADWSLIESQDYDGWCPASASGKLIFDTLSARIHPRRACTALAGAIQAKGGRIGRDLTPSGQLVWATGWQGLQEISTALQRPVGNGVKGQALLVELDRRDLPQLFIDTLHVIPHSDGTTAIGSTSERDFAQGHETDTQLEALYQRALQNIPALKGAKILQRWAGVRPRAKSRAPILGPHPSRPGDFIANGGFKIGFGMAPKVGEVLSDLVLEGSETIPQDFHPEASL